MSLDDIARVRQNFVDAAIRARDAGFEWLELHFAHGYLAQSFFSAHSNQRDDIYGGSVENRARFLLETLRAVREVWPEHLALTVRSACWNTTAATSRRWSNRSPWCASSRRAAWT
jgi:2,4-dienoyl-CoA reductase-like NADH-dependent reductase (Old Yellow Enzyme family)